MIPHALLQEICILLYGINGGGHSCSEIIRMNITLLCSCGEKYPHSEIFLELFMYLA
jgi:hypothetical protein